MERSRRDTVEHTITIDGRFENVAIALSSLDSLTVLEISDTHVLCSLPDGAAALARRARGLDAAEEVVEVIVVDTPAGPAVAALVATLDAVLDYKVVLTAE